MLSETMPLGCLVATSTASILLLTLQTVEGSPSIQYRSFKTPQGLLGSLGRRMSTLIFGSMPAQSVDTRLVKLLAQKKDAKTVDLQVLCSQSLQCWQVTDSERLLYQCDVDKLARESFITHIWSRDSTNIHQLKIWMLDAHVFKGDLVLLVAAVNPNVGSQVQYALATLPLAHSPTNFSSFCVLKFATNLRGDKSGDANQQPRGHFLIAGSNAYVYSDKWILCVPSNEPLEEPDRIEVRTANERLLGAGILEQRPVFFSTRHGVLLLKQTTLDDQPSFLEESTAMESSFVSNGPDLAQVLW